MLPDNPDINQTKYHLAQYVGRYPKKTTAALEIVEKEVDYNQTECYCRLVVRNTSTFAIGNLQPFLWLSANRSTRREQQPILSWHLSASAIESNATANLFLRIRGYVEPECCQLALRWQRRLSNRNDVDQGAAGTTTEHALQTTLEVPWHALSIELVKSAIEIMCTEK
ncbi:hypothetical protein BDF19DRAFT_458443 [Syncephalis fuscata]|nr:hypothetical protein BDF19DRAFT_458443 [Syncephalis fuscata]